MKIRILGISTTNANDKVAPRESTSCYALDYSKNEFGAVLKALNGKILLKSCSNFCPVSNNKFTEIRTRSQMGGCFEFDDDDDENAYHYDEYDDDDENDNNLYWSVVNCLMQPPISNETKRAVIEDYLRGKNRDPIAIDLCLGTGTVSKIISEWKAGLDYPIADELRELVLGLRKLGVSASRYAEGARIASDLIRLGVDDEEFHQFVSEIYTGCKKMGLQPDKVAYLLKQLLNLTESVPVQQITEYIELQTSRVRKLKREINDLELKALDAKTRLDISLNEEGTTRTELNQYSSLKAVMKKNGVDMFDNSELMGAVVGARQLGFDPRVIVEKVSNLEKLETEQKALQEKVKFLNEEIHRLGLSCSYLEKEELVHSHRISIYKDLESMGMGIKELKLLWNTIAEIATANKISEDRASEKFFSDVREQYDDKLGFEVTLQNLKSEIEKNQQVHVLLSAFTATFNSIIMGQFDQIQKVSSFIEFGPLVKAAKGEMVPTNQLKNAVIKAIDILISSDPTDRSASVLNTTKLLLQEDIQKSDIQGSGDIA